jgi:hypothetical protein
LVSDPDGFVQRLVEVALRLCDAHSVGISVESTDDEGKAVFRWVAIAGELKDMVGERRHDTSVHVEYASIRTNPC